MKYYDLSPLERNTFYKKMQKDIDDDLLHDTIAMIRKYASDNDTYVRKNCYLILSKIYKNDQKKRKIILSVLDILSKMDEEHIRQTVVYTLGEIGKQHFEPVATRLDYFLHDSHHKVKNALTGAIKQLGEKKPRVVFAWVKEKLEVCNTDIMLKLLHGLELRGRTHPQELLPIIRELAQKDIDKKTQKMIVHIVGQISYKEGCLEVVTSELQNWEDNQLVTKCVNEILSVHERYKRFSHYSPLEAQTYLSHNI